MLTLSVLIQGILFGLWSGLLVDIYINDKVPLAAIMIVALLLGGLMVPIFSTMSAFVSTMWLCCCGLSAFVGLALFD